MSKIDINKLPKVPNVCRQVLREVWKSKEVSIAHVIMAAGNISLLHKHKKITELYYFLEGSGEMDLGGKKFRVKKEMLVEVKPDVPHRLRNTGRKLLKHLVICNPAFNPRDVILLK
jgi:mannose-6-phosphate isomerase-like protein (cupin superfamily)